MDQLYSEILALAAEAAQKAGIFIREGRKKGLHVDAKSRIDFVSDKDKQSETLIREMIRKKYPEHLFFGEESIYGDSPVNYIRDYPQYAISIGVVHHREIIVGVIYDPFRDELFTAQKGKGAFRNGLPIHVSDAREAGDAIINTSMPTNSMLTRENMVARIPLVSETFQSMRIWNCAAISLASVACGRSDADYEAGIHLWDMAAGILLVREAGGTVTQLDGSPCALTETDVLATNGHIHEAAVRALNT